FLFIFFRKYLKFLRKVSKNCFSIKYITAPTIVANKETINNLSTQTENVKEGDNQTKRIEITIINTKNENVLFLKSNILPPSLRTSNTVVCTGNFILTAYHI